MAVTFTASEASVAVRNLPGVILTKTSLLTISTATSVSSVFLLCKVPHNALILDFMFFLDDAGGSGTANQVTNVQWQLGLSQPEGLSGSNTVTRSAIRSLISLVVTAPRDIRPTGANLPYRVNISSESLQRWAWITCTTGSSLTTSASAVMRFTVKYTMDGG